jgi:predicted dehydrogenase
MDNSRRKFLSDSSTLAAGALVTSSLALNACKEKKEESKEAIAAKSSDGRKLVCGAIGVRGMGGADLEAFLEQPNTECAAICDVDENVLKQAIKEVTEQQGKAPKGYKDFRKLLDHEGLDVIIIGTPDHWHCLPFVYACKKGYSVYSEKPLAHHIGEVNVMEDTVKKYNSVVQIGQWQRSNKHWSDAMDYVHSGKLGKISLVRAWTNRGVDFRIPQTPDSEPPAGVDYDFWLGPAKKRPFNKYRFHGNFRWFWDYAGGLMTDWGVHMLDFALEGMKVKDPTSIMAMGGKLARPEDMDETPDTLTVVYEFEGFNLTWNNYYGSNTSYFKRGHGVCFVGTNGTLIVNRNGWEVLPEYSGGGENRKALLEAVPLKKKYDDGLSQHMANFIDCIKNGGKPNANIEIGANVARLAILGNLAYKIGRRLYWDGEKREFINDDDANKHIIPEYRKPWEFPTV